MKTWSKEIHKLLHIASSLYISCTWKLLYSRVWILVINRRKINPTSTLFYKGKVVDNIKSRETFLNIPLLFMEEGMHYSTTTLCISKAVEHYGCDYTVKKRRTGNWSMVQTQRTTQWLAPIPSPRREGTLWQFFKFLYIFLIELFIIAQNDSDSELRVEYYG